MASVGSNVVVNIEANASQFDVGMHRAKKATKEFETQTKKTNGTLRMMRGGFGQVGHQIQDVAVQLQMGQNAMLVFGQQGSQIASLFGPRGAMIGAVLAVGAAISMALMPRLFGATEAMKEVQQETESLIDKFDKLNGAAKQLALTKAREKIDDFKHAIKESNKEIEFQQMKLRHLAFTTNISEKQVLKIIKAIEEEAAKIQIANQSIDDLTEKTDGVTASFQKQEDRLKKQIATYGLHGHALRAAGYEEEALAGTIKKAEAEKLKALSKTLQQKEIKATSDAQILAMEKEIATYGMSARAIRDYEIRQQAQRGEIELTAAMQLIAHNAELARLDEKVKKEKEAEAAIKKAQVKAQQEAQKALNEKEMAAKNFAEGFATSFTNAITTAETFSEAMKGVAKSVVDSLLQMIVQKQIADAIFNIIPASLGGGRSTQTATATATATASTGSALTNLTNQAFGSTVTSPFTTMQPRANGGLVTKGRPYMVGERGHELFVPNESGNIIPNNKLDGGSVTINQTINISTGVQQTVRAEIANLMPKIADATKNAVAESRMRGGSFSKSLVGG